MKRAIEVVAMKLTHAAATAKSFWMALLTVALCLPLHADDFNFIKIIDSLPGIDGQENDFNYSHLRAKLHDYSGGDLPGAIGAHRQKVKASLTVRSDQYNYTQVDVPGAVFTALEAINSRGQTVESYDDGSGTTHGLLRNVDGSFVTIDYPGATFTKANGINSQGYVVGRWDDARGITHSFLRTPLETIMSFDPPTPCVATSADTPTAAKGINDGGDIAGRCWNARGKELAWLLRNDGRFAILDDPSFLTTDAWAINNSRVVVGDYSDASGFVHGYAWTEAAGFMTLDFQNNQTGLRDIDTRGDIGGIFFDGVTNRGFLRLKNGTNVLIDPPGTVDTEFVAVNNSGIIAGLYFDADFNGHGYIAIAKQRD